MGTIFRWLRCWVGMSALVSMTMQAALLTVASTAPAGPAAKPEVFKLTYGECPGAEMFASGVREQLGTKKPEGITAEPEFQGKPQYGSLSLVPADQDKPFLVAIDKTAQNAFALYIDRDRDGDLAEEKPIAVTAAGGKFELAVPANGTQTNRLFTARIHAMSESASMLMLQDRGAWHGKARAGDEELDIILIDGNRNSVYNDAFPMPEPGQYLRSTPDMFLTKPMSGRTPDFGAIGICPATLEVGGKLYNTAVAADGSGITVAPFDGKTATLTAPDGLSAILGIRGRFVTSTAREGKLLVPAGKMRLFIYTCRRKDAKGVEWTLMSQPDFNAKPIEVPAGGSVAFPAGLPLQVAVNADAAGPKGKVAPGATVRLTPAITDAAGSAVRITSLSEKGEPQEPPATFIVIKQDGKELVRGKCGFG